MIRVVRKHQELLTEHYIMNLEEKMKSEHESAHSANISAVHIDTKYEYR